MEQPIIIMDMSGAYKTQNFYKIVENTDAKISQSIHWVDCCDVQGTNCYCQEEAKEEIGHRLSAFGPEGIHFIDSGNYHYLTLQWISKIQEDFILIHFDNHPDLQAPSFGEITSCGGWLLEAVEHCQHLQKAYMVGVEPALLQEVSPLPGKIVVGMPGDTKTEEKGDSEETIIQNPRPLPVYITIDKDVLAPDYAVCDWSQGRTTRDELIELLQSIYSRYAVIGVDICGEAKDVYHEASTQINDETNGILLEALLEMMPKESTQ